MTGEEKIKNYAYGNGIDDDIDDTSYSLKSKIMKLWIGRDNPIIPEDMEHYIERHPEDEIRYAKLHIFYDKPIWSNGCWRYSREMCEVSNYMFPEIKPGECIEFKSEQL